MIKVRSAGVIGIEGVGVLVEVEVRSGVPAIEVTGVSPTQAKECAVRVRAALATVGCPLQGRAVVQIAPLAESGAALDLPIAVGILAASGIVPDGALVGRIFAGELALDGSLRAIRGALPMALYAKQAGHASITLPASSAGEAASVGGVFAPLAARSLTEVVLHLRGESVLPTARWDTLPACTVVPDLSKMRGLDTARRALEIAAAGGHNLLLLGPPGSGKSLLARCLPTVLPPLDEKEAIETTAIYSAAGKLDGASLLTTRPFRAPHHDVSVAGLIGGGPVPRPGEISLAHHGVLFLDELPEFKRPTLEALRRPMEDKQVTIARSKSTVSLPSKFTLVAAMNLCPCGYRGSTVRPCECHADRVKRYFDRLAGILDLFDLRVEVAPADYSTMRSDRLGEASADVRERVVAARVRQRARWYAPNAKMKAGQIKNHCRLDDAADRILESAARRFAWSERAVHRILRVARTVADLAGREKIAASDAAEAIAFWREP